ncbi:MAG: phosphopantothenoylcysteine decarboxylase [Candidatus Omnitrophota bacterium]|nr:phosphopantothenoylcysteine decarboxylase [Candidatus Omnitrophota bacterium]
MLKNRKILITAGPTWIPIDNVRVISNTSTGKTGILLAEGLAKRGAKITLLLGPIGAYSLNKKIKVVNFKFFDELNSLVKNELKKKHDAIIQAAAISDYQPIKASKTKLNSDKDILKLVFKRTPKIIASLRRAAPGSFLVGFKFEPDLSGNKLVNKGRSLLKNSALDLVVANTSKNRRYAAYLVSNKQVGVQVLSKEKMIESLIDLIGEKI